MCPPPDGTELSLICGIRRNGGQAPEQRSDTSPSLAGLTGMSLRDLAGLDSSLLHAALDPLLPACGGVGGRLWQNNGVN